MICLFSSIKEIFTGQPLIPFQGGACKARKSVIVVPCTCLPDSNNPDIEKAYSLTHSLRMILDKKCDKEAGRRSIKKCYAKVGVFDNRAFNDIAAAMYDREDEILNYFVNRSTNASAESLNAKIKDFRAQLRGGFDKKYFIFRLVNNFG